MFQTWMLELAICLNCSIKNNWEPPPNLLANVRRKELCPKGGEPAVETSPRKGEDEE
jgi:hypothetical protein